MGEGSRQTQLLTDREHLIIQLHYADGWSLRRIARGIGCTYSSVWRSHQRALMHLRWFAEQQEKYPQTLRLRLGLVSQRDTSTYRGCDEPQEDTG